MAKQKTPAKKVIPKNTNTQTLKKGIIAPVAICTIIPDTPYNIEANK